VVDEETDSRRHAAEVLASEGYDVREAADGADALRAARERLPDLVILDLALTRSDPDRLIKSFTHKNPDIDVLVTTRQRQVPEQVRAFEAGDYLQKPVDASELLAKVRRLEVRQQFYRQFQFIGKNEKIIEVMEKVLQIAPTQIQVLVTGESGTGKDVIARALHHYSPRRDGPFIPVNCGAIAEGVLESELFGHERGAFTGATNRREGYFEQANGGTVFLDEVGEMPLATQVKLLRVLEQQTFLRVGGTRPVHTDVRIIAATNKDLHEAIRHGTFRSDLYFRLNAVNIHLPALRERRDDILRLIRHFVAEAAQKHRIRFAGFTDEVLTWLVEYDWPGNIRELRNIVETLVVTSQGRKVQAGDLPTPIYAPPVLNRSLPVSLNRSREDLEREMLYKILWEIRTMLSELPVRVVEALSGHTPRSLPERFLIPEEDHIQIQSDDLTPVETAPEPRSMEAWEKEAIARALERHRGHREKAARELGIGERTLYRKIKKYGLDHKTAP
jgi:DNA-binding NtrC family response regulator